MLVEFFPLLSLDCYRLHKRISYREVFEIISVRKTNMLDEDFSPYLTGGSNLISIMESGSERGPPLGLRKLDCSEGGEKEKI